MSTDEAKDMMIRDALETAIKSERELIRLKRMCRIRAAVECALVVCAVVLHVINR